MRGIPLDFATWDASDYAAWWGALVATAALAWNIARALRSGPRIHLRANAGMRIRPLDPLHGDRDYILLAAANRGNAATTITHFLGFWAASRWAAWCRKREPFVLTDFAGMVPLPHVVRPGEEWHGKADQSKLPEHYLRTGCLYVGVAHNQSRRSVYIRVRSRNT